MTALADLVRTSARVAENPGRLAKIRELADFLKQLDSDEIEVAIPYLSGETRQGKLSIGYGMLAAARASASSTPALSIEDVDAAFRGLKAVKGKGSASKREALLKALFDLATAEEQDFLFRLLIGELRQGALEGVMLEAVALAASVPAADIRRAATFAGNVAPVARAVLTQGALSLARFSVRLMQPIIPMLAQPAPDAMAALDTLGNALLEWKLDGARVQVHKDGDEIRVFTRTLNEVTAAVPEVVAAARAAPARRLILDGEAIALRPDGKPWPFQQTMRRFGRKQDDEAKRQALPLSVYFFDCMLANERILVDAPLAERRRVLEGAVLPQNITPAITTADPARATEFYDDALRHGHEGIMAKGLAAPYEAGRRGATWLKVKKTHTLDLVVLAAEWGHGRRKGRLSNLHLGARDPATGEFVMLGKTFKGLTDAMLERQTRELLERETSRDELTVRVRPELVVEIAFNDLQESPHYPGGLALRFARVKRYREDKRAADADTIDTVRQIAASQGAG